MLCSMGRVEIRVVGEEPVLPPGEVHLRLSTRTKGSQYFTIRYVPLHSIILFPHGQYELMKTVDLKTGGLRLELVLRPDSL